MNDKWKDEKQKKSLDDISCLYCIISFSILSSKFFNNFIVYFHFFKYFIEEKDVIRKYITFSISY